MKVMGADGLGFAVPIDAVCKIIEHFKTKGYFRMLRTLQYHVYVFNLTYVFISFLISNRKNCKHKPPTPPSPTTLTGPSIKKKKN